jgi:ADP-heptose:LPS heptosyltransferase
MSELPIVVHLCCFNEAAFIEPCIRSVIDHVDAIYVIEGAWLTAAKTCGLTHSNDGTLEILKKLRKEYPNKISVSCLNEPTQLDQRNKHFELCDKPHWLWILDGDEIYQPEEVEKIAAATRRTDYEAFKATSLTFVNDAYHYVTIDFPRLFRINEFGYKFVDPNTLRKPNGELQTLCREPIAEFYHYSYLERSPGRMRQKIDDRIATHSEFKWQNVGGYIKRDGINFKTNSHVPEIVRGHPLLAGSAPAEAFRYNKRDNIGFLICSGMGNLIMATPMLKALRACKPDARISVLTWDRGSDIIQGWGVIDDVITKHHAHFVNSIGGLDYLLVSPTAHIKYPGVFEYSKNIVLPKDKGGAWGKHESAYNMDLIRDAFGYIGPTPSCECFISEQNIQYAESFVGKPGSYIVVAAGYLHEAHWHNKHFGNKNYAALLPFLAQYSDIIMLGDEDDRENADRILADSGINNGVNFCGQTERSIKNAAAIIRGAKAVVGNDGGLLHIAACFNVPTMAIWTFTNPIKNMPRNSRLKLVMLPCRKRTTCQHGNWEKCIYKPCKDIPVSLAVRKFVELMEK